MTDHPQPPIGSSPAYASGWTDAADGFPLPAGASAAYAHGYRDYLDFCDED